MEEDYVKLQEERAEVRARYPEVVFPNPVLEPVWFGRRALTKVEDRFAIVDQRTQRMFNFCSGDYKVVHYEDIIKMTEDVVSHVEGYGKIQLCPAILSEGGKMKLTMKFPEARQSILQKKEAIFPKMDVLSSYDLRYKLMGKFGAFVLRCTNGMGVWQNFKRFARKHLWDLDLKELEQTILEGLSIFNIQVDEWRKWADAIIDLENYNNVWQFLPFSEAEKEKIEVLPEIQTGLIIKDAVPSKDLTVWNFNSILTQFVTHEIKSDLRKIEIEPEIARTMERLYLSVAA